MIINKFSKKGGFPIFVLSKNQWDNLQQNINQLCMIAGYDVETAESILIELIESKMFNVHEIKGQ